MYVHVCVFQYIWNLAIPDIGVLPDIGSHGDTISGHVFRYRGFHLTRYRDMSRVTRYRVPISGTHPISGHHVTDIVNHIPDIGINIGYNIWCPDIGDMISRYRCQYREPISGVLISDVYAPRAVLGWLALMLAAIRQEKQSSKRLQCLYMPCTTCSTS